MLQNTLLSDFKYWLHIYAQNPRASYRRSALKWHKALCDIRTTDALSELLESAVYRDISAYFYLRQDELWLLKIHQIKKTIEQRQEAQIQAITQLAQIYTHGQHQYLQHAIIQLFNEILNHPYFILLNESLDFMNEFKEKKHLDYLLKNIQNFSFNETNIDESADFLKICYRLNETLIRYLKRSPRYQIHSNETKTHQILDLALNIYARLMNTHAYDIEIKSPHYCVIC